MKHKLAHTTLDNEITILLKGDRIDSIHQSIDAHSGCNSVRKNQLGFGSSPLPERTLERDAEVTTIRLVTTNIVFFPSHKMPNSLVRSWIKHLMPSPSIARFLVHNPEKNPKIVKEIAIHDMP